MPPMFNVALVLDGTGQQTELHLMTALFQEGFWVAGWAGGTGTSADCGGT